MISKNLDSVINHLGFLGYQIEIREANKDKKDSKDLVVAKHGKLNNIVILELSPSILNFRTILSTERKPSQDMDKAINDTNKILDVSRAFYDVDSKDGLAILVLDAVYLGEYNKESFSEFHALFVEDHKRPMSLDNFKKAFLAE